MIRFTRHARNRPRFWRLSESDVVAAVNQPDALTPSIKGRSNVWKHQAEGWLRATIVGEVEDTAIMTVTRRRRGPQGETTT